MRLADVNFALTSATSESRHLGNKLREPVTTALQRLLASDDENGTLVRSRTLFVSRAHYANVLGYKRSYLGMVGEKVFEEYDAKLEQRLLDRVRLFLQEHAASGTILFYRGGVNRTWIGEALEITSKLLLTKRFDDLLAPYNANPSLHDSAEVRLIAQAKTALSAGAFPRSNDGLTVSVRAFAKQLRTYPFKLKDEPFKTLIDQANQRAKDGDFLRPGEVIAGGKLRSFRALIPQWPENLIDKIAKSFDTSFGSSQEGAPFVHRLAVKVFAWIARSRIPSVRKCYNALRLGKLPEQAEWGILWNSLLEETRRASKTKGLKESSYDLELYSLTRIFQAFALSGLFPELPSPPRRVPKKRIEAKTKHRRTVVEARPAKPTASPDYLDQAVDLVSNVLAENLDEGEFENEETAEFLEVLRQEMASETDLTSSEVPDAVKSILDRRLKLISEAARRIIEDAQAHLDVGKLLIAEADFNQASLEKVLNAEHPRQRQALLNHWFPRQPEPHQMRSTLANLLSISTLHYGGVIPSVTSGNALSIPGFPTSRIAIVARTVGRRREIAKHLVPSGEAVCAVLIEFMVAAAGNPAVALSLSTNCMSPSDKAGFVQVTGKKMRAGGKPIRNDFHERSDVLRNLKWLVESFENHRSADCKGLQDLLAVMQVGIELRAVNEQYLLIAFRALISSIPKLSGLNIVPSMIRRSVIVLQTLSSVDGSLSAALANQSKPINKIYNHIFPVLVQRDMRMREFIRHFESLLLVFAADTNDLLGYERPEIDARRETLEQTGLGTLCKNAYGKPGNEGKPCAEPRCAGDMCPQMDIRLHPSNVALLLAWKEALIEVEPDWERDRAERWNEIWLPFLCLIKVIEEKSSRGALLAAWDAGKEFLHQLKNQPGFKGPRPW